MGVIAIVVQPSFRSSGTVAQNFGRFLPDTRVPDRNVSIALALEPW